ncbi:hypothetical protein PUMCH_001734 [Australozyma saopauloensis]|uniref:Phytanoyl-CoA dioxygenase n=1 Tax=Australozyma saopauloensis TaxID=291208 RepID=A0AAX4H7C0_9ASCO|nr:hypothetical protein PUMCH_001734 [[Candida] saopauloensis]
MTGLTKTQLDDFASEGMICIPEFLSSSEVENLRLEARKLLLQLDIESHPKTLFETGDGDHVGDKYFLDSSDQISYFFDTDAFGTDGKLRFLPEIAVNKIGHGLHMKNQLYHQITFSDRVKDIVRDLGYKDPRVLQSMLIFKNPTESELETARDNEVPSHSDGTFLFTKPQSAVGFWIALEDCTTENGCLSYSPGTHKTVPISKRFVRLEGGKKGCGFEDVPINVDVPVDDPESYRNVECPAGSLILIHNAVLHKSEKNRLEKSRWAYAFHAIDGTDGYDEKNWLQVPSSGGTNFLKLYEE